MVCYVAMLLRNSICLLRNNVDIIETAYQVKVKKLSASTHIITRGSVEIFTVLRTM